MHAATLQTAAFDPTVHFQEQGVRLFQTMSPVIYVFTSVNTRFQLIVVMRLSSNLVLNSDTARSSQLLPCACSCCSDTMRHINVLKHFLCKDRATSFSWMEAARDCIEHQAVDQLWVATT